ncbi:hypothetical protein ACLQ18_41520 [Streptomyces sp. DT193]|uniref:hypothetical protein n=1 Tax=Streptomyces sp. DT193 TaxID=3393418 RepID=UPI003CF6DE78
MTGGELTLGAVLARLEEREREIAAQAETTREQIAQLTARLDELGRTAEDVRITRKTLLELPDPQPPAPPAPKLPDHPAYQQIMAVFTAADHPLRARQVCEAMDLEIAPNNINNTRLKLKRLTERGILVEAEQGLFHPATAVAARRHRGQPAYPSRKSETDNQLTYHPLAAGKPAISRPLDRAVRLGPSFALCAA